MFFALDRKAQLALIVAGLVLAQAAGGCGGGGSSGDADPPAVPQAPAAPPWVGYGLVNGWRGHCEELAVTMATAGLNLHEFEATQQPTGTANHDTLWSPDELLFCVQGMRRYNIWSFVNLVNWNNCDARKQSDAWFVEKRDFVINAIGPDRVILGGASEPYSSKCGGRNEGKAKHWNELVRNSPWTGMVAMPSDGSGDYAKPKYGFAADLIDSHFCRSDRIRDALSKAKPFVLHNTDCTPLLTNHAGDFARRARESGANLLVYDHFGKEPDHEAINSMAPAG